VSKSAQQHDKFRRRNYTCERCYTYILHEPRWFPRPVSKASKQAPRHAMHIYISFIEDSIPFHASMQIPVLLLYLYKIHPTSPSYTILQPRIIPHYGVLVKPLQQRLVHDQHCAALHTRPDTSGADTSEPAGNTLGAVDDFECFHHALRVEADLSVLLESCTSAGGRDRLAASIGLLH
jgi:hypothetical protein